MNFGEMMVQMLYKTHVSMSVENPIIQHMFNVPVYDFSKLSEKDFEKITNTCFEKYKKTEIGKSYGSVDVNPSQWSMFYVETMKIAQSERKVVSGVPNGCCNTNRCGIKLFYEIVNNYFHEISEQI